MQTDYERYIKMSSLAQIGWWEADFAAGHYLCSDFLCDLLGLEGDTISFRDFQELIREDYREQIIQEFRANANIHRNFYEQTFPVHSKYGEIWLHTRLVLREKGTGINGGDKSFGVIQRVETPKESDQRDALRRVNSLLRRQSFISQSLLRFLRDEEIESCVTEILNDKDVFISSNMTRIILIRVVHMKWFPKGCPRKKTASSICLSTKQNGGLGRFSPVRLSCWTR